MGKVNFQDVGIVPMFAVNGPEIQFGISIFGVSVATLAVGLALLTGLAFSRHGLRETTLLGPWAWSLIAAGACWHAKQRSCFTTLDPVCCPTG